MDKSISHILIVDDDPNQLEILHEFLKRKGFLPVSAQSGSAALALSESDERIDVALIDLQLEDMSGLDVLRGIKEHSPKTECILLTGNASQKTAIEAIQLGAYGYFQKPFDIEQVHLFIQRAVEKQAVENALHKSEARYRDLVENSQDLICTHDLQGNLLFVNEAGTKMSGCSNETLLKMNVRDILAPEMRDQFDAYLAEIQAKGQAHGLMRIQTAGGEIRYLEFKNTLQTEGLTTPIVRSMARDVTKRKQAEDALRASEAHLKEAQRVGRIGSWDWDATTDTIQWSEEYYRIYCLDPSQPPPGYEEHLKVYTAESAARLEAAVKNSMQTGNPYELDLEFVCAAGARRWVTARGEIKRDAKGQVVGLRGTALDITERKQAEEALYEQQQVFRTLVENSPDIIARYDRDCRRIYINPAYLKTAQLPQQELLATSPVQHSPLPADSAAVLQNLLRKVLDSGVAEAVDVIWPKADHIDYWYNIYASPEVDREGRVVSVITVSRDITERKKAEEALNQSEEKFRLLVENASEVFYQVSLQNDPLRGEVVFVSPQVETMTGHRVEEFLRDSELWIKSIYPDDLPNLFETTQTLVTRRIAVTREYRMWDKSRNNLRWFSDHTTPRFDAQGQVIGYQGIARDITERKWAEDSLRESEETLRESQKIAGLGSYVLDFASGMWTSSNILDEIFGIDETYVRSVGNWATLVHPGDRDQMLDYFTKEVVGKLGHFDMEYRIVRDNDKAERWVHGLGKLDIDERQQPIRLHGTILDITERKHAEQALAASEAELRALFASMQDVVLVIDSEGVYRKIAPTNPSLLVMPPQELLNKNLRDVFPAEQAQSFIDSVEQVLATRQTAYIEYALTIGERMIWFSTSISPMTEESTLWVARDVTERKQAEEEIRQRVTELETLNHVSVVLRTIASQDQMLAIVLEETLKALHAENGSIQLWNKATNHLHKSMARGWPAEVTELPQEINEGIAGRVFTGGENYISRDMLNDPVMRAAARSQIPPGWGGICVPIRSAEQTLGTLFIAIPGEREFNKDEIRLLNTLAEMTGASLHRMSLYEEAVRRMKDLQALRDVDQAITSNFDLRPTLDTVITHAIAQLGVDAADILLLRPHLKFLEYAAGHGFRTPLAKGASVRLGDSLAGRAALERRTIHVSNLTEAHTNADFAAFWKSEGFAAYFCAPLLAKGEVKGVLEVYQRKPLPSEPEWLSYLETLAGQAAIAIDSTQLFDNLQRANLELGIAYETTIESWSKALSLRDSETESHTQHVTEMVTALARSFNFNEEEIQHIRRGAILHDIGKMGVPDQILLKPGPLTDEEWIIVRGHPQVAYDMLKPIAYLRDSLDVPYCHHEKWDGSGYPRGLAGDHIPLAARIFATVDVYDALTNDRPYRKAWSNEKALEYIREQSGKHFDPQVVNAFLLEFGRKRSIVSGRSSL